MAHLPKCYNTDKLMSKTNPVFIKKMIGMFIKLSKEYLVNINKALGSCDIDKINQLAHYIKPSVDLLCIDSIKQSVREIEQATEISSDLADTINFTNHRLQMVIDQMQLDSE
jgi:HPt (histidine-containing phosphotransfer) domain-containing protein